MYYTFGRKKVGHDLRDLFGEAPVFGAGAVFDHRGKITRHRYAFAGGGFGGHGLGLVLNRMYVPRHRTALAALGVAEVLEFVHDRNSAANGDADLVKAVPPRHFYMGGEQRLDGCDYAGGGHGIGFRYVASSPLFLALCHATSFLR